MLQNKAWLFSGSGITALAIAWWAIRRLLSRDKTPSPNPASQSQFNINVSPNISPVFAGVEQVGSASGEQKRRAPDTSEGVNSNVCSLRPEITTVLYNEESGVFEKANGESAVTAALLPFSNEARIGRRTAPVGSLIARLTYYKRDGIEEFKRIDYGCWLNEEDRYASLGVGEIAYIVVALHGNGEVLAVARNPRRSAEGRSRDEAEADSLPRGAYDLKVDLVGGVHGEYAETYWYQVEAGERLEVKRSRQRPASMV